MVAAAGELLRIGRWRFDPANNALIDEREGSTRRLEPRAAALLAMLAEQPGQPVGKEAIAERLWGGIVSDEAIVATVARLRRHLGDGGRDGSAIETIPKVGYRLMSEAEAAPPAGRRLPAWWAAAAAALLLLMGALWWLSRPAPEDEDVARARQLIARESDAEVRAAEALLKEAAARRGADEAVIALAELYAGKNAGQLGLRADEARERALAELAVAERAGADRHALGVARGEIALQLDHDPAAARRWIAGRPMSEASAHLAVRALAAEGDIDGAGAVAEEAVRRFPGSDRLLWDKVLVNYLSGDSARATAVLDKVVAAAPTPRGWLAALIRLQTGEREAARQEWLRFYRGRSRSEQWLPLFRDSSPAAFTAMIRAMDEAGEASCADLAFAAAQIGDGQGARRAIERCEQSRHPLAPILRRYPIFAEM